MCIVCCCSKSLGNFGDVPKYLTRMAFCPKVLIGIPDETILPEDDFRNGWTTNKFGGTPNWMQGPPAEYPQCSLCKSFLPLVAQIYCPLEDSPFHRVLYMFACTNNSCWNKKQSWKVLRCQKRDENVQTKFSHIEEKDNWFDEDDEWGAQEVDDQATQSMSPLEEIEQQTRNLNITDSDTGILDSMSSNQHEKSQQVFNVNQFVPYYIDVIEESHLLSETKILSKYEKQLLAEYEKKEGVQGISEVLESSMSKGWSGEKYEQGHAKHGDKIFQKFLKQVNLCKEQCLRYSLNGNPLLLTVENIGEIPCCTSCGTKRVFEIQLMPALVLFLQSNQNEFSKSQTACATSDENFADSQQDSGKCKEESGTHNIEFGTVYIYTCSNSCWSEDTMFQEEYAVVHSDPDQKHVAQF